MKKPSDKNLPEPTQNRKSFLPALHSEAKPINPPAIIPDLEQQNFLIRVAESIFFTLQFIEYAISPNGTLRFWIKCCLYLFIYLSIPIILFTPLIMYLSQEFVPLSEYLLETSVNLSFTLIFLAIISLLVWFIAVIIKKIIK
jgi:hypothetical protein